LSLALPTLAIDLPFARAQPKEFAMAESTLDQVVAPVPEWRIGRSVSLDHAAEILGVSRRTIYNRIRDGRLMTIKTIGGSQRVLLESVHGDGNRHRRSEDL